MTFRLENRSGSWKKYILLFYSSTLIELIYLVRINHVLWRHHDVISTFSVKYDPTDHFWSKMTKKNPEIKSWNTKIQQTAIIWQIFRWNSSFLVDFHAKNSQEWTQFFTNLVENVIFTWKFIFCGSEMLFLTIIWTILGGEFVIFTRKFSFWGLKNLFRSENLIFCSFLTILELCRPLRSTAW